MSSDSLVGKLFWARDIEDPDAIAAQGREVRVVSENPDGSFQVQVGSEQKIVRLELKNLMQVSGESIRRAA